MNMTQEETIQKWSPVINNIGYTGPKLHEIANFCEHYFKNEMISSLKEPYENLLPMSLKILTDSVYFQSPNVQLELCGDTENNTLDTYSVSEIVKRSELEGTKECGVNYIDMLECKLREQATKQLNELLINALEKNNNVILKTNLLCNNISAITEGLNPVCLELKLRYKIK